VRHQHTSPSKEGGGQPERAPSRRLLSSLSTGKQLTGDREKIAPVHHSLKIYCLLFPKTYFHQRWGAQRRVFSVSVSECVRTTGNKKWTIEEKNLPRSQNLTRNGVIATSELPPPLSSSSCPSPSALVLRPPTNSKPYFSAIDSN